MEMEAKGQLMDAMDAAGESLCRMHWCVLREARSEVLGKKSGAVLVIVFLITCLPSSPLTESAKALLHRTRGKTCQQTVPDQEILCLPNLLDESAVHEIKKFLFTSLDTSGHLLSNDHPRGVTYLRTDISR